MVSTAFTLLLLLHGAIHLMGFAKAFGYAKLDQLHLPITPAVGVLWLITALLLLAGAGWRLIDPTRWWLAALPAILLSQGLIISAWSDAKAGTVANLIIAVPIAIALVNQRPSSLPMRFQRDAAERLHVTAEPAVVTEADLGHLPPLVQRYLRRVGVLGQPRVHNLRARFHGRLRNGMDAPWMTVDVEQISTFDEPARLFFLQASMYGLPFVGYHRFVGPHAAMDIRVLGLVPVVTAHGPQMDQSETVTFFNDLCLMAPAALIDAPVRWEARDAHSVIGHYTQAGRTVSAVLTFDAQGDLSNFTSGDRYQSADGKTHHLLPWSTPVREFRSYGPYRLSAKAEAVWQNPDGPFTYADFDLIDLVCNVDAPTPGPAGQR